MALFAGVRAGVVSRMDVAFRAGFGGTDSNLFGNGVPPGNRSSIVCSIPQRSDEAALAQLLGRTLREHLGVELVALREGAVETPEAALRQAAKPVAIRDQAERVVPPVLLLVEENSENSSSENSFSEN